METPGHDVPLPRVNRIGLSRRPAPAACGGKRGHGFAFASARDLNVQTAWRQPGILRRPVPGKSGMGVVRRMSTSISRELHNPAFSRAAGQAGVVLRERGGLVGAPGLRKICLKKILRWTRSLGKAEIEREIRPLPERRLPRIWIPRVCRGNVTPLVFYGFFAWLKSPVLLLLRKDLSGTLRKTLGQNVRARKNVRACPGGKVACPEHGQSGRICQESTSSPSGESSEKQKSFPLSRT